MLLRNGGVLLFPVKVTRLIKIFGFSISILSFQGNFLKRYFKAKNHIYFLKKKMLFPWQVRVKIKFLQNTQERRKITFNRNEIHNEEEWHKSLKSSSHFEFVRQRKSLNLKVILTLSKEEKRMLTS